MYRAYQPQRSEAVPELHARESGEIRGRIRLRIGREFTIPPVLIQQNFVLKTSPLRDCSVYSGGRVWILR